MEEAAKKREDIELQQSRISTQREKGGQAGPVPEEEKTEQDELRHIGALDRQLKSRHVQFLALSGAIGTGLFVGTGQAMSVGGPLSAFLAYAITGFNLFCVINSLGEMAAWLPIPGAVPIFAARYVDPALGFTLSWNYWYQLAIGVPIEVSACVVVLDYWNHPVPQVAVITAFFAAMVLINCLPVRMYGEAEFVFGAIKLTTIVGLILLMFIITVGGSPAGKPIGFLYWIDPGPMNEASPEPGCSLTKANTPLTTCFVPLVSGARRPRPVPCLLEGLHPGDVRLRRQRDGGGGVR